MSEYCVFDNKKTCNDCGDCLVCDLDKNKQCNSCGRCLDMDGLDSRAVSIDEIMEENYEKVGNEDVYENLTDLTDEEMPWEFIDDIQELKDLMQQEEKLSKLSHEEFPGLIILKKDEEA